MNKKILMGLIILGLIFVGSATYALFNENLVLDVASDIQVNDASLSNNQPNIQNNQANNIVNSGNSSLSFNNMANTVLNDVDGINDNSVLNDNKTHNNKKIVKEIGRRTEGNNSYVFYDDFTCKFLYGDEPSDSYDVLETVVDTSTLDGGYVMCSDCGNYIPIGKVSGLVAEKYLCHCPDEHPTSVKDVPFVYTEESVLQDTWCTEVSSKPLDNSFNVDSEDVSNINIPDEVNQQNIENTN